MVVTPVLGAMNLTNYVNGFYSWNFIDQKFVLYFSYHRNASSQTQLSLWFSSSFKNVKLLTAWRTLHNDGRQPMAIGHLSDFLFIKKEAEIELLKHLWYLFFFLPKFALKDGMVPAVEANVASTVEFRTDVIEWQGSVREDAKWDGKGSNAIHVLSSFITYMLFYYTMFL